MRKLFTTIPFVFLTLFIFTYKADAQHHEDHDDHTEKPDTAHTVAHDPEKHGDAQLHTFFRNHLAIFFDGTTNFNHHATAPTFGLDYEFRISRAFGIGLEGEILIGNTKEIIAGVPVFYHTNFRLKILAAPMFAFPYGEEESPEPDTGEEHHSSGPMYGFRLGVGYDFHLLRFSVSPAVQYDYIGKTSSLVYGLAFGVGF